MLVVIGVIATMSAYAQDGGKQQVKQKESKREVKLKQEIAIQPKFNREKKETFTQTSNKNKLLAEPKKHEEKRINYTE